MARSRSNKMREPLRKQVESQRDKKRVRKMDFDETADSETDGDWMA